MRLPHAVPLTQDAVEAIARRHGIRAGRVEALPTTGMINSVYSLGDEHVLRVPRRHPAHVAQARAEAAAIPAAVAAGVRTPKLVAFDDAMDILPVPYLVVERVRRTDVESLALDPPDPADAWLELGRDLARLHAVSRGERAADELGDARVLVEERAQDG